MNETKSRLAADDTRKRGFCGRPARSPQRRAMARLCYADKKIIGALASLYVDESVIQAAERAGILILGMNEEMIAMRVLNAPGFAPREF